MIKTITSDRCCFVEREISIVMVISIAMVISICATWEGALLLTTDSSGSCL